MKKDSLKIYELAANAKGHEFVNGNTKHLDKMDQKDLAVLFNNGDPRVKVKKEKAAVSAPDPINTVVEAIKA